MRHTYVGLDGIRGIAALAVLLFHLREWVGGPMFFGHGYLAVDLFFMMSGFVICHAYGERLTRPKTFFPFLRDRIIRLHPLLVLGAVLGTIAMYARAAAYLGNVAPYPALTILAAAIPVPAPWTNPEHFAAFPINASTWSLFWELLINIVFALIVGRLSRIGLGLIVGVSGAIMLVFCAKNGGFSSLGLSVAARITVSFFIGIVVLKVHHRVPQALAKLAPIAPLILILCFTLLPANSRFSVIYDPVVVLGVFPVLILAIANHDTHWKRSASWLGAVSYPLYILHWPTILLLDVVLHRYAVSEPLVFAGMAVGIVVLVSIAASKLYDEPVRKYLRARFGSKRHRQSTPSTFFI